MNKIYYEQKAFTLIELSIVLVIIGLISGGVLLGRDLIKASQRRSQISQIENYDSAVQAFKLKYNCLPGDCANPQDIGMGSFTNLSGGDDIISGGTSLVLDNPEAQNFWYQLSLAGLVSGNFTPYSAQDDIPGIDSPALKLAGVGVKYGQSPTLANPLGGVWIVYRDRYFAVIMPNANHAWFLTSTLAINTWFGVYLAEDAYALDIKIDDGFPRTGNFQAVSGSYVTGLAHSYQSPIIPGACIKNNGSDPSAATYNLNDPAAKAPSFLTLCSPLIRASF